MKAVLLAAAMASAGPAVTIRTSSIVVVENQPFRVTCKVPQRVDNRWLVIGVEGMRQSTRQLNGEEAQVTHELFVDHLPCGVGPAFCTVITSDEKQRTVNSTVRVVGPDCNDDAGMGLPSKE